ncbi:hypothetical protein L202_03618 [Cryptococcus amylolentus CBS 6039]|uniref:tRNA-splicing endonuclease subunit Sen15 domain-containing protein n=2 Tax=Cryptococcus amylolentus TaxID=104669 RepID=A0A1E3HTK7_9TREE|nr:hypothetical protein L202_03618 [Cryptococcus amylolentus CBS 6039]ODN79689.1 hypothetical protein L202_03618 [Cryptococcus amylolentus CBS 6039]ODO07993.1 hypothetical protein I350_03576 [Cryptococcus amylolentus CBS 6273]
MPVNIPKHILPYLERHPLQAGPLLTSVKDLSLSVGWTDMRIVSLTGDASEWTVIIGRKRKEDPLRAALPLPIHTTSLRPSALRAIFKALESFDYDSLPPVMPPFAPTLDEMRETLGVQLPVDGELVGEGTGADGAVKTEAGAAKDNKEFDKETLYTAIVTGDSTVVYYKIAKGIKKPHDIPDE